MDPFRRRRAAGRLCGNGARIWLALQADWDIAKARQQLGAELEQVPEYRG
jgi:plasmid maintenance system antidote protein VapI